ncbi:hypothetical protein F2Q69_00031623 [Brassica cretica]|uniref:Uncharacterized protein n=1 Tax=Brassica cretica TaxID=69181 RepID=A0A8S9RW79_BRACR|nr:hypothetical protein F2Q69_00031623 [Brassica cretica]
MMYVEAIGTNSIKLWSTLKFRIGNGLGISYHPLREPPLADLHPMRVLFIIPRENPPQLDEHFSRPVKEFVSLSFTKVPAEEDDKAEAPEDEMVVKGHDVEKKHNWNQRLKNRRRGSRKL